MILIVFLTFVLLFLPLALTINLSKYLCELISPNLPNEFCTKDTFTFVEELKEVSINDKFLVSYDVNSLFKNIPFKETIKLAVYLIKTSYPNLKESSDNLTKGASINYVGGGGGGVGLEGQEGFTNFSRNFS